MHIGLSGLLFDELGLTALARAVHRIGYAAVELRGTEHQLPPDTTTQRVRAIADALRGTPIVNIATHVGNFALLDAPAGEVQVALARRYIEWAAALGATSVRVWPGWIASADAEDVHWHRATTALHRCAEIADAAGVRIALEIHHATLADTGPSAARLMEAINHPAVRLIFDPANLMQTPAPFGPAAIDAIWDHLGLVHVKDHAFAQAGDSDAYPFADYQRHIGQWVPDMRLPRRRQGPACYAKRALGAGHIPWPAILAELHRRGFAGHLIVESERGPGMPAGATLATQEFATLRGWVDDVSGA